MRRWLPISPALATFYCLKEEAYLYAQLFFIVFPFTIVSFPSNIPFSSLRSAQKHSSLVHGKSVHDFLGNGCYVLGNHASMDAQHYESAQSFFNHGRTGPCLHSSKSTEGSFHGTGCAR